MVDFSWLTPGVIAASLSGGGTFFAAALAFWQKGKKAPRTPSEEEVARSHLDEAQRLFLDQVLLDNERYRKIAHEKQKEAEFWQGSARRTDRYAHKAYHQLNNERMFLKERTFVPFPPPPMLETPLTVGDSSDASFP